MEIRSQKEGKIFPKILFLFFIFLFTFILFALRDVAMMLVVSYVVAYIVDPLLDILQKKKIPRGLGVIFIVCLFLCALFVLVLVIAPYLVAELNSLKEKVPDILNYCKLNFVNISNYLIERFPKLKEFEFSIDSLFSYVTGENIQKILGTVSNTLLKGYSYTLTIINLFLFPVFAYYICIDFDKINKSFLYLFPNKAKKEIISLAKDIDKNISTYLRGQLLICFLMSILYSIGLGIVGVDLWLLIAFFSGFANLIPYLGVTLGVIFAVIMALFSGGSWVMIGGVVLVYTTVSVLDSMFITPKIQGKNIGISPLAIMLALIAGAKLLGIFGMLISIPVLSSIKVIFNRYYFYSIKNLFEKKVE